MMVQLNLYTMATWPLWPSGHGKEVAIAERFKQESMYGFFVRRDEKRGRCREVAVSRGSNVLNKTIDLSIHLVSVKFNNILWILNW